MLFVCLFERPVNVVNCRDVSSVIRVDFAALGIDICGGAISGDGFKMCVNVKPVGQCTIAKHRTTPAPFVPKNISSSNVYVLITVSSRNKNEVWLTTSATIEIVGLRYEQSWKNNTRSKAAWTDLLTQSQLVDEDDPDAAAVAEKIVIDNHNAIQVACAATPRKRTREEAMLEVCGQNEEELENFVFTMARDGSGSATVLEL